MRNTVAAYFIAIAITMLVYFDTKPKTTKKNQPQLDLLNSKISLFKVVLELLILLFCNSVI